MRRFFLAAALLAAAVPAAAQGLPQGFVYLRDIAPGIAQDIRYAGSDNFTGQPLPGYEAPECVLREPVARTLASVQDKLAGQGLGLKVYDCYRPTKSVQAMLRWAAAENSSSQTDERFYPHVLRRSLVTRGYIGAHSVHSTGSAVDLTVVSRAPSAPTTAAGPCHGPADDSIDMGTGFDCFDPQAWTEAPTIGETARRNRAMLVAVMQRHGFANYRREWWHFTFTGAPQSEARDFPITPRSAR